MSFGWGAGDVAAAVSLLWKVCQALDDANGAPEHHRQTEIQVAVIEMRLNYQSTSDVDLRESDFPRLEWLKTQLQTAMDDLASLVEKGSGMHTPHRRRRDWALAQVKKIEWDFKLKKDAEKLLGHIHHLTDGLVEMSAKLESDKRYDKQKENYKALMAVLQRVEATSTSNSKLVQEIMTRYDMILGPFEVGPEIGFPSSQENPSPSPQSSFQGGLSHLRGELIACSTMSPLTAIAVNDLRTDYPVKQSISNWLKGVRCPRLWMHGPRAKDVSAIVSHAVSKMDCPVIAFPCRHVDESGIQLTQKQRVTRLIFSLLGQAKLIYDHRYETGNQLKEVDGLLGDLNTKTVDSIPLALKALIHLLDRIPRCVVIVDGWDSLTDLTGSNDQQIDKYLKDVLEMFHAGPSDGRDDRTDKRLLVTTPGPCRWLNNQERSYVESFGVTPHLNKGHVKLSASLLEIDWK